MDQAISIPVFMNIKGPGPSVTFPEWGGYFSLPNQII